MVTVNGKLILDPFIDVEAKDDIRLDDKKINYNTDLTTIFLTSLKVIYQQSQMKKVGKLFLN